VDYISSPGYLDGGEARTRYGFIGGGPSAIVTTLGILRPDAKTKEFVLTGWFAFTDVQEVRASTGWDLKVAADAQVLPEPSAAELAALRSVDATGMLRKEAAR
jgi:glutaconate CoA-transferase subunit B